MIASRTHTRRFGLSKSKITAFEQCPKRLWLSIHCPDLAEQGEGFLARFATGNLVGEIACALHPGGFMVEANPSLSSALAITSSLIAGGHPGPIFEATFEHDGVLVRVDVLERLESGGWAAAEVKSSASVKDYHRGDLATQVWVMREAGIDVKRAAIRHIDTGFVLSREGDYAGLFTDADLLGALEQVVVGRPAMVAEARAMLAGDEPVREMGDHCTSPFTCEFGAYCSRDLPAGPEWPVTLLPYGGGKRWVEKGVESLLDLAESDLNPKHAQILAATRDDKPFHNAEGARKAMAGWGWPRAWLDFETVAPAIPRWIGTRPFQQIPFQFSLHLERRGGRMTHHEFLSCDGSDPRRACAEALLADIPEGATIIAYNAAFERRVLRDLARAFPDLAARLEAMAEATVDLLPVARNHWYHRDQRGSWSIKAVLPTIAPELDYGMLEVKDGGDAQAAWSEAADPACDPVRRSALEEALKVYCARDTWAMVVLARKIGMENV
jgi:CRISPR/Cas system-associated exonuclease Cas4 (RecB family)